ncbi:MAG: hypothetical protein AAGJ81_01550 [Verrucomicrobiota bacterium]
MRDETILIIALIQTYGAALCAVVDLAMKGPVPLILWLVYSMATFFAFIRVGAELHHARKQSSTSQPRP